MPVFCMAELRTRKERLIERCKAFILKERLIRFLPPPQADMEPLSFFENKINFTLCGPFSDSSCCWPGEPELETPRDGGSNGGEE